MSEDRSLSDLVIIKIYKSHKYRELMITKPSCITEDLIGVPVVPVYIVNDKISIGDLSTASNLMFGRSWDDINSQEFYRDKVLSTFLKEKDINSLFEKIESCGI